MRHNISGRKLNRKTSHRIALLKNLSKSLIIHEQIETTLPKAKDLRPFVEKILTISKTNNLASKRRVLSYLGNKEIVEKVFNVLAKRYQKRNGGYVRILKSGFRYGDSAPKAVVELVERDTSAKGLSDKLRLKEKEQTTESVSQNNDLQSQPEKLSQKKKPENSKVKKEEVVSKEQK